MHGLPTYDYDESLKRWKEILTSETDNRKRAEMMLKDAVILLDRGRIAFDPILTCEALGEAEKAGANDLQAEAYNRIGTFWGKSYPTLSLSIWRAAERLYDDLHKERELDSVRLNLALSCFLTADKYECFDSQIADEYRKEARVIVQGVSSPISDNSTVAFFKLVKGTIFGDAILLKQARTFYEQNSLWDFAISCLDEEVRLAIDDDKRQEALPLIRLVREYSTKLDDYDFANEIEDKLTNIKDLLNGPRIVSKPVEKNNLLDILDVIAYYEERIVFHPVRKALKMIGDKTEAKKFILLENGRLMPKFREQMRLFRGESKYHKVCKSSLWRLGMNEKEIFRERLKLAEFCRALSLMPEIKLFNMGVSVLDPGGEIHHYSLNIDGLALAQHYGVKTELLDLTSDKWTAAFFACTDYNRAMDIYTPITKSEEKGVMYCYTVSPDDIEHERIRIVGAQPFERPTTQAAFMMKLWKEDNFNDMCSDQSFFCQDPMTSIIVYHFANRAGRMFPQELIQMKTHSLIQDSINKHYSPEIVDSVRQAFYVSMPDKEFKKLLDDVEIGQRGEYQITISDEEQNIQQSHFDRFQRILSSIEVQWYTTIEAK